MATAEHDPSAFVAVTSTFHLPADAGDPEIVITSVVVPHPFTLLCNVAEKPGGNPTTEQDVGELRMTTDPENEYPAFPEITVGGGLNVGAAMSRKE